MNLRWRLSVLLMWSLCAIRAAGAADFSAATRAIDKAIADGKTPGAVLLVGKGSEIVFEQAFGSRSLLPERRSMMADTIFDLASLTKPVATATSVMILVDRGVIGLQDPIAKHIPEFGNNGKEVITVEQLLLHRGGLVPDNPMSDYANAAPSEALAKIYASKPRWTPGTHFAYSDVGFIVLGELVHRVDGRTVDRFAQDEIFGPLAMSETRYLPPEAWRERVALTQSRKGKWTPGEVHDPRAFALGGVAGHAGLFGTARDIARWVQMLNNGGELNGRRLLKRETVDQMLRKQALPDGSGARGLGVDIDSSFATIRGGRFDAEKSFGHTGYTGTMFWSDPASDVYLVLLTNRVHPDDKASIQGLRREVATIVAEEMLGATTSPAAK